MGREAICQLQWAGESGEAKVLLETQELIVRGGGGLSRRAVPIQLLTQVEVDGEQLRFHAGADAVTLTLGQAQAQSWAKKLTAPPPTLAAKLGIDAGTQVSLIGNFDSAELAGAIAAAASTESRHPDLILAHLRNLGDLDYALDLLKTHASHPPVWIIYPKGAGKAIGETQIRETLRRAGWMDTKVASVSATLTALRFNARAS
jgi:hypothetical protein